MIAIQEKQSVTLLTVESFGNNSTVMLVRNTVTIADLEGKESDQISKRTEKIWSNSVDELILNCESSGDNLLGFTSIIWRKKQLLASRTSGDIFSLPDGELGRFSQARNCQSLLIKWGVSSRWSFRPNFAWGSIETATIRKTNLTLYVKFECVDCN